MCVCVCVFFSFQDEQIALRFCDLYDNFCVYVCVLFLYLIDKIYIYIYIIG